MHHATPAVQSSSSCPHRVIYKASGPDAETNGTLTPEVKAQLDGMTLEEVVEQIKATGGKAFSSGKSAYRGVSPWKSGRWRAAIRVGGRQTAVYADSELQAAHCYDALCRQYGRQVVTAAGDMLVQLLSTSMPT